MFYNGHHGRLAVQVNDAVNISGYVTRSWTLIFAIDVEMKDSAGPSDYTDSVTTTEPI